MSYIAYSKNDDGSINVLAGSENPSVFAKILPDSQEYRISRQTPVTAGGKTWLSDEEPGYLKAKKAEDSAKAIAALDEDYSNKKKELSAQFADDMLHDDKDAMASDVESMKELDAWYDEEYTKLMDEEGEANQASA